LIYSPQNAILIYYSHLAKTVWVGRKHNRSVLCCIGSENLDQEKKEQLEQIENILVITLGTFARSFL
jgi:hypothetical protein